MMCTSFPRRWLSLALATLFAVVCAWGVPTLAFATPTPDDTVDVVSEEGAALLGESGQLLVNPTPVVALDPGHGGSDSGATGYGLLEKDINWKISMATKEWLENHGVQVFLTHNGTEHGADGSSTPSIYDRVQRAVNAGACVIVSQHTNSGGGTGFEVWVPWSCDYYPNTSSSCHALARSVGSKLSGLGLFNRGVKISRLDDTYYENGDLADYYGVIRYGRRAGTPALIIEHAFIDNPDDAAKLGDDNVLRQMGYADAEAIYENLNTLYDAYKYNQEHPYRKEPVVKRDVEGATYRLWNTSTGEHLLTTSYNEAETLAEGVWRYEGVAFYTSPTAATTVQRIFNTKTGEHLYTSDANEVSTHLASGDWTKDDCVLNALPEGQGKPVYRLFNPNAENSKSSHNYTMDANERRTLIDKYGWRDEDIAWYALESATAAPSEAPSEPSGPATPTGTPIMGASATTKEALAERFVSLMNRYGKVYPAVYAQKGAPTARDFANTLWDEATAEGVRPEVLLAQVIKETGWLQFGGMVKVEQCNFGGIGALDNSHGESVATFESVAQGLRAQTQHLKAYGSTDALVNPCVDPRFQLVSRGCAPTVEELGGRWATGANYGVEIVELMKTLI